MKFTITCISTIKCFLISMFFIMAMKIYPEDSKILQDTSDENKFVIQNNETDNTILNDFTEMDLINAVINGDSIKLKSFIAAGADVNQSLGYAHKGAQTLLMKAASLGQNEIIKILLEAGADINAKDDAFFPSDDNFDQNGKTAFFYAIDGGHYETVKLFIQLGVDVNQQNRTGGTPINYAAHNGYVDIVELLIKSGANVNCPKNASPLTMAIRGKHDDVIKQLIKAGADVNIKGDFGFPPLILASFLGDKEIVKLLIQSGADVNIKDNKGNTALGEARKKGYDDIVTILQEAGAFEQSKYK